MGPGISMGNICSHLPTSFEWTKYSHILLKIKNVVLFSVTFSDEIRMLLSGLRKAKMLLRGLQGIREIEQSSEAAGLLTQLKRMGSIT